jgi:hypothetical protein
VKDTVRHSLYIIAFNIKYKKDKNIPTSIHVKLFSYLAKFETMFKIKIKIPETIEQKE